MNEKTMLQELKNWLNDHSKKCRELQRESVASGDSLGERCYHGMNSAYINASNAVDSLLNNKILNKDIQ